MCHGGRTKKAGSQRELKPRPRPKSRGGGRGREEEEPQDPLASLSQGEAELQRTGGGGTVAWPEPRPDPHTTLSPINFNIRRKMGGARKKEPTKSGGRNRETSGGSGDSGDTRRRTRGFRRTRDEAPLISFPRQNYLNNFRRRTNPGRRDCR